MTIYIVDVHVVTHTCPADPTPHAVDIRRRIVHLIPGRPCATPANIHSGQTTATVPCGRYVPYERQCANCRTIVTVRTVTTEHRGYEGPVALEPTLFNEAIA